MTAFLNKWNNYALIPQIDFKNKFSIFVVETK